MGKRAKSSRKGKKAWRANISTVDIDDFFEKSTKGALSGGSVAGPASDALFFVDESRRSRKELPLSFQEIVKEDEEKEIRHLSRVVAKQERLKQWPPRLGKHKYEPAPMRVLLSEDITGSLRQLKGCCTLAKDRFKSLEKRGQIVPTAKGCLVLTLFLWANETQALTSYFSCDAAEGDGWLNMS